MGGVAYGWYLKLRDRPASKAGKEGAGAQEERPRRAGASWGRGKLGGRQPAPAQGSFTRAWGPRDKSWPAGPGDRHPRGPAPSGSAENGEQTSRDRASREAPDMGAGRRLFTLPQTHSECLPDAWHQSPPWGHRNAQFMPSTAGSMCHHASTVMKRELGRGHSSDTALHPRSQTCRPLSLSWHPGQACLQAWRQTAMPRCRWRGPGLGGDRAGTCSGRVQTS